MFIVICGGGKIGFSLAKQLHEENNKVVVIERNHTVCENISKDLDIIVINGDACQPDFLE